MILAMVVLGTLGRMVFVWNASMVDLMQRSTDDAYYYFNVARNIVEGLGITFDGMNVTNGFHPLWMLTLLPVTRVAGPDPDTTLRAIFCMVALITGAGFLAAYKAIASNASRTAAALGMGLLLVPVFLNGFLNGLETGLLLSLLFATMWAIARYDLLSTQSTAGQNAALGALLALILLTRLDAIFIVLAIICVFWVKWLRGADGCTRFGSLVATTARVSLVPVVAVGAYVLWNVAVFGHASPISGALKSTFPTNTFAPQRLAEPHRLYGEAQLVVSAIGLLWLRRRRTGLTPSVPPILVALWMGSFVHLLHSTIYVNWAAHWWHFASYTPLTVITTTLVFDRVCERSRCRALVMGVAAGLVAAVGLGLYVDREIRAVHHRPWYDAALWARETLPEDAVIGMTDAGLFGYFSRRPTVNLDGVINGYEYQEALRDHRLTEYLESCGVTHIADYEVRYRNGIYVIRLPARLHGRAGGAIEATPAAEVYASADYTQGAFKGGTIHFAIWDLRRLRVIDDVTTMMQGHLSPRGSPSPARPNSPASSTWCRGGSRGALAARTESRYR
jgi:hypothetical protein